MGPKEIIELIIDVFEGGLSDDPYDPGGRTKYGISQRTFPKLDIKNLTKDEATDIYIEHYYNRYHVDQVPFPTNLHYLDMCITGGGVKALQIACNSLGYPEKLTVDNALGKKTITAMKWLADKSPIEVYMAYFSGRLDHYRGITGRPDSHYRSWMRRMSLLNMEIVKRGYFDKLTSCNCKCSHPSDEIKKVNTPQSEKKHGIIGIEEFFLYSVIDALDHQTNYYDGDKLKYKYKKDWLSKLGDSDVAVFETRRDK